MKNLTKEKIIKIYIFIILYSSLLKLILGRWGTIVADIATITIGIYCLYNKKEFKIVYNKKNKLIFGAIFLVQFISFFEILNPNITNHLYALIEYRKSYFQVISLFFVYLLVKECKIDINDLIKYIAKISIPLLLYGIKQYFWWTNLDNKLLSMNDADFTTLRFAGHIRSISIFSGPFHFGLFSVLLFSLFIYLTLKESKKYSIGIIISIMATFCSITRTNTICMISASVIWCLMFLKNDCKKKNIILKYIIILLGCIILLFIVSGKVTNIKLISDSPLGSLINSLSNIENDTRFTGRIERWVKAINAIFSHPIIGYGIGAAGDTMEMYNISKVFVTSHNMILKIWMETGLVGLIAYLIVIIKTLIRIKVSFKNDYFIRTLFYSLFSSIFINGLVGSTICSFPSITLYWILSGILLAEEDKKIMKG